MTEKRRMKESDFTSEIKNERPAATDRPNTYRPQDIQTNQAGESSQLDHSKPQSRRLTWMTMSFTALSTNLIWFVSVAHVKWVCEGRTCQRVSTCWRGRGAAYVDLLC